MVSYIGNGIAFAVGISGLALLLLYAKQNSLLYMPNPPGLPRTPDENPRGWRSPEEWRNNNDPEFIFQDKFVTVSILLFSE
jgi:hypothetical protein